ncbi:MAG: hypothetical protein H6739_24080 [Alphaproteobacteria bacterium]|nr:hypothetical protein [Alphaproteobacteria bacterium]
MSAPPPTSRLRKLAFAGITLVMCFAIAELSARLFFADDLAAAEAPPPPPEDGAPTHKGNPYLLWEQAPGVRVEHGIPAHINSLGLRGPEPTIPKPPGVRRLLATGDSSVYGFRVADDAFFVHVAAELLGGEEAKIEGWNAAIPGYSTWQTLNLLDMRAWALEPDVLIVGNLWSDNNFDSFVDRELLSAYSTWEDGPRARLHHLLLPSAFYRVLKYRVRVASGSNAEARKVGWMVGDGTQIGRRRVEVNDYAANLERMVQEALRRDAAVLFVMLANEDDMRGPRREPAAWSLYRQVMKDTAARHGAPIVEVPQLFRATQKGKDDLFIDEMHPTALGHRIIAEAIAEALRPWAETGAPVMGEGNGEAMPTYTDTFTFGDGGRGGEGPRSDGPAAPKRDIQEEEMALRGELVMPSFKGQRIQLDVVRIGQSGQPEMLGASLLERPGPFELMMPRAKGEVGFLVYDDVTGDGPSADDGRVDLSHKTVPLPAEGPLEGVIVDVSAGTVTLAQGAP